MNDSQDDEPLRTAMLAHLGQIMQAMTKLEAAIRERWPEKAHELEGLDFPKLSDGPSHRCSRD